MKRTHLRLIVLFTLSYLALLLYPVVYLISPVLETTTHQFAVGAIFLLTLPAYIVAYQLFGVSFPKEMFTYPLQHGRRIQRGFVVFIALFIFGVVNALLFTAVTGTTVIPFAVWNPYAEGLVLLAVLGALLVQLAVFHRTKQDFIETTNEIIDESAEVDVEAIQEEYLDDDS